MFNKASFKFKKDDVFLSYLQANPKFKIHFFLNRAKINSGLDTDSQYDSNVISVYEYEHEGFDVTPFLEKASSKPIHFFNDDLTKNSGWEPLTASSEYTSSYTDVTSSLLKNYIIKNSSTDEADIIDGVSSQLTLDKLGALYNIYNYYNYLSPYFDFNKYIAINKGLTRKGKTYPEPINDYVSLIEVPRLYRGNKVKEGSLRLSFYYTGSLVAAAEDVYKNGVIYETTGNNVGEAIGTILYPEGIIFITASYALNNDSTIKDGYLSPVTTASISTDWVDRPRWGHFMSYQSYITSSTDVNLSKYAPASSSYTIEFKGETLVPTYTMMAHADKNDLVWSNNPTFVEKKQIHDGKTYNDIYVSSTGSKHYEENELISIKNIVSSSFIHSESFSPTTHISKIGVYDEEGDLIAVANLATPVKKTTEQDYTFKLKLDL